MYNKNYDVVPFFACSAKFKFNNGFSLMADFPYEFIISKKQSLITTPYPSPSTFLVSVPPQFSHPDQMSHSHVMKPIGAFARLKCRASGRPRPRIVWFKDGVMLIGGVPGHLGKWVLKLSDLQARDSGRYTCRVTNQAGSINFTYTVEVVGKLQSFM